MPWWLRVVSTALIVLLIAGVLALVWPLIERDCRDIIEWWSTP